MKYKADFLELKWTMTVHYYFMKPIKHLNIDGDFSVMMIFTDTLLRKVNISFDIYQII